MLEVARETERRDPGEVLAGPEPLPVRFYRDAALSFLAGRRDRENG